MNLHTFGSDTFIVFDQYWNNEMLCLSEIPVLVFKEINLFFG